MISISSATVFLAKKTKNLLRNIIVHEMKRSAAGYGLYNDNLFPDSEPKPTVDLHFNKRRPRVPRH